MEFYETTELRGQLDNWCGPNIACLLAFARTAGFARVDFESVLAERAHVSAYRRWKPEGDGQPPQIICIENSTTHNHDFSGAGDDYLTFYFTHEGAELNCDSVYPEIGGYGSRPLYVAKTGGGWQASCKLPPGLATGWCRARLRAESSRYSAPLRIGIDISHSDRRNWRASEAPGLEMTRISDGRTFESGRIRVGEGGAVSVWVSGLPEDGALADIRLRLNGSDLPAVWLAPATGEARQVNALLPAGLEPGCAALSLVFRDSETQPVEIELYR